MRFSATAIFLIVFILVFSIFVANFANIISTDEKLAKKLNNNLNKNDYHQNHKELVIDDKNEHLFWFLQISDIHISQFQDKDRIEQLRQFTDKTLDIIKPRVVLASGDLTDAKNKDKLGSKQYKTEWESYKNVLDHSNVKNKTLWLDIRGNHDYFNVPDINSEANFFNKYSMQGGEHQRSYLKQIKDGNDKYSFIGVDACLEPGLKRPFNFIGLLNVDETSRIIDLAEESRRLGSNYTIWFGHYPTSCILSPGVGNGGIRNIIGRYEEGYAYLCGHLHTQGGLVPKMYTLQKDGFLELELGDWKVNRLFRLAAFDHGLFSFVDVKHGDWPIVLVTNPKHALFNIPSKENSTLQLKSTHIRILIFNPSKITHCSARIDDHAWENCKFVGGNLYVVKWDPEQYQNGIHRLEVLIHTEEGLSKNVRQPFSLDGSRLNFDLLARFILMTDAYKLFQTLYGLACLYILPLCVCRIWHELILAGKCTRPRLRSQFLRRIVKKYWTLSSIDRIFFPILLYCVYITIGPLSMGEIIDGHYGVVFMWGIFVNDSFLPGALTYLYGFFEMICCQIPLTIIYANIVNRRLKQISHIVPKQPRKLKIKWKFGHLPFILILSVQVVLAYFFWAQYGTLSIIMTPFRTWSIIFNIVLWRMAWRIPESCFRPVVSIWGS